MVNVGGAADPEQTPVPTRKAGVVQVTSANATGTSASCRKLSEKHLTVVGSLANETRTQDRLVVASANPDKVRELRELLSVALPDCVLVQRPSHLNSKRSWLYGGARTRIYESSCRATCHHIQPGHLARLFGVTHRELALRNPKTQARFYRPCLLCALADCIFRAGAQYFRIRCISVQPTR